jgi:resuscitation-promoting factor RpfB
MPPQAPAPAWYPDPKNSQQLRYWDGTRWTEHTHQLRPGILSGGPATPVAPQGRPNQGGLVPWWQTWFAIVPGLLLCLPVGLIGLWKRSGTSDIAKMTVTLVTIPLFAFALFTSSASGDSDENPDAKADDIAQTLPSETPTPEPTLEAPVMARAPAVTGSDVTDAREEIRDAGLKVGRIERQPSAKAAGTVLRQSIVKNTALELGSVVTLVVAAPFPRVPSVVGDGRASAIRQLEDAGFRVETSVENRTSGKDDVVLRQGPTSGTRAKPGSIVQLVISNYVKPAPVVQAPPSNCTPGYSPCLTPASDYDCAGGSGNGPAYTGYVTITGSDPYDLDSDGDGVGCES